MQSWLSTALGVLCLSACSAAEEAQSEPSPVPPPADTGGPAAGLHLIDADVQRKFQTPLSDAQKAYVIGVLASAGWEVSDADFIGSMVYDRDAYMDVEPLVQGFDVHGALEKARANAGVYARRSSTGAFLLSRPIVNGLIDKLAVPNSAPASLVTGLNQAIADIANADPNDCLPPNFMTVERQSVVDARRTIERSQFGIVLDLNLVIHPVIIGAAGTVCLSLPVGFEGGCGELPNGRADGRRTAPPVSEIGFNGSSDSYFTAGKTMGLTSGVNLGSGGPLVTLLTHEVLHMLGIGHPREELAFSKILVPGTLDGPSGFPSIMHDPLLIDPEGNVERDASGNALANPDQSRTLTSDDIDAIRTLYAPPCLDVTDPNADVETTVVAR